MVGMFGPFKVPMVPRLSNRVRSKIYMLHIVGVRLYSVKLHHIVLHGVSHS